MASLFGTEAAIQRLIDGDYNSKDIILLIKKYRECKSKAAEKAVSLVSPVLLPIELRTIKSVSEMAKEGERKILEGILKRCGGSHLIKDQESDSNGGY